MHANRRLYLFLILFPSLLLVVASWDYGRVTELPERDRSPFYPAVTTRSKDENTTAKDPAAADRAAPVIVKGGPTRPVENHEPDPNAMSRAVRHWTRNVARLAAVSALVALLIGIGGLLLLHRASRVALRSRDDLVREFDRAHRLLPYLLGGATISLSIALSGVLGFESIHLASSLDSNAIAARLMVVFAGAAAGTLALTFRALRSLKAAFAIMPEESTSLVAKEITRADAPGLWAWIEQLALRAATAPPEWIIAGLMEGFSVTSHMVRLEPGAETISGTILHLSLAELTILDEAETAAIVSHELGHFSGADLDYSKRFRPIYEGIGRSLEAATAPGRQRDGSLALVTIPAWLLGSWCMAQFHEAVMHWSRVREFDADQFGAAVAGRRAAVTALVRSIACDKPIAAARASVRRNPSSAPTDLVREIRSIAARDGFDDPSLHLDVTIAHPTDTHPPTSERILALGESVPLSAEIAAIAVRAADADAQPWCAPMFSDFDALSREVSRDFVDAVAKQEAAFDERLASVAAISIEPRDLVERTWPSVALFVALSLACAAFGLTLFSPDNPTRARVFGIVALTLAMLFGARALHHWKRSRTPFMRLAADGFTLYGATDTIAWTDVLDIAHSQLRNAVTFNFLMQENVSLSLGRAHYRRAKYRAESGLLSIAVTGVREVGSDGYIDLVYRYQYAAHASALLRERIAAREGDHSIE